MGVEKINGLSDVDKSGQSVSSKLLTDGVLIAGITALAYAVAFAYEYGYCSNFGIPNYLINPSITTILVAFFSIVIFAIFALMFGELFSYFPSDPGLDHLKRRLILFLLMFALVSMATGLRWINFVLIGPVTAELLIYLLELFVQRGTFKERLVASSKSFDRSPTRDNPAVRYIFNRLGAQGFTIFGWVYLCLILSFSAGSYESRNQSDFQILVGAPNLALVRIYGEMAVFVDVTKPLKSPGSKFQIRRFSGDSTSLELERRPLGELPRHNPTSGVGDLWRGFWSWIQGPSSP